MIIFGNGEGNPAPAGNPGRDGQEPQSCGYRGVAPGRIERLMLRHGIRCRGTTDSRHGPPIAKLIARNFTAAAANRIWLAYITYFPLQRAGCTWPPSWPSPDRKIVGWAKRDHMRVELASSALTMAIQQQRPEAVQGTMTDTGA
jgi:transposase InsO family protein